MVVRSARRFVDAAHADARKDALGLRVNNETSTIINMQSPGVCRKGVDCVYAQQSRCNHEHPYQWCPQVVKKKN